MNKNTLRLSCFFLFPVLHVCAGQSPAEEVDAFLRSNVVAAVVGYHTTREIANGIRIPFFSPSQEAGNTNAYGVLLYVVAPANYAGNFFWFRGEGPHDAMMMSDFYRPEHFYQFTLTPVDSREDIRKLLFDVRKDISTCGEYRGCSLQYPIYVSSEELEKRLDHIRASQREWNEKIPELEKALADSKLQKERSTNKYFLLKARQRIVWAKEEEIELLRQRPLVHEQWKALRESVPPGFAWGDFSYTDEWKRIQKAEEADETTDEKTGEKEQKVDN